MNKKILYFIIGIIVVIILGIWLMVTVNNNRYIKTAVIVKVTETGLLAMEIDSGRLYSFGMTDEGNIGFNQGQEINIWFSGNIVQTYPEILEDIRKIEIIKRESETIIPKHIIRYCYNSKDNVNISVSDFTNKGMTLTITDTNNVPYDYSLIQYNSYNINKKVKNINYSRNIIKTEENTNNSISPAIVSGPEYIFEPVEKISNMSIEDTIELQTYNNLDLLENTYKIGWKFDWVSLYGELTGRRI